MSDKEKEDGSLELNSEKQEHFCQAYVNGSGNGRKAYEAAYNAENMSVGAIYTEASRLLKNPKITLRIKHLREELYARNKATIDEIIYRAGEMMRADIRDAFNDDNTLKQINRLPERLGMAITSIETDEIMVKGEKIGETKKLKMFDPGKAMEIIMKHLGGYEKDNKQKDFGKIILHLPDNGRNKQ